jgi:membrane-bound serine protease (ClpP class)
MRRVNILYLLVFVLGLCPFFCRGSNFPVQEISILEVNAAITPATLDYLKLQFTRVPDQSLIVVKLNTPGGLVTVTKDIITLIGIQTKPIVVWIAPEGASASSAGAIIAAAAHFILMSPGSNIGAATPVGLGEDIKETDGRAKILNDLTALVRSLSQSRGRPSKPFEDMIATAKSLTDQEALKAKIIDGVISHEASLTEVLNGKSFLLQGESRTLTLKENTVIKTYAPTAGQKLLEVLANPTTAYFLFLIGVALIYFEFQAPGGFIAGGVGLFFLILAAISFQVLPLDWGAFALIIFGAALLITEIFVTSYGLLAAGGIIAFAAGSLFLFHGESGFISIDYPIILSTLLGVGTGLAILVWYLVREARRHQAKSHFFLPIGARGVVLGQGATNKQEYQIKVRGVIWRGLSETELQVGDEVEVVNIEEDKLLAEIKKINKESI